MSTSGDIAVLDLGGGTKLGQPVAWDGYPLAFSPDGRLAAVASSVDNDGRLDRRRHRAGRPRTADAAVATRRPLAAFSPDGASVAVGYAPSDGESAEIEIFSTADGRSERRLTVSGVPVHRRASGLEPGRPRDRGRGHAPRPHTRRCHVRREARRPSATGVDQVDHVSYDPDGRLFVAGEPGYAFVFDRAGKTIKTYPLPDHAYMTGAWGPDGTLVLPDYRNGEIRVVDPVTDLQTGAVYVGPAGFTDVAVGPMAAVDCGVSPASAANVISLWDVESGQAIGEPIEATSTSAGNPIVNFKTALTTDTENHRMILWDLDPAVWRVRACEAAGRNLTLDEWKNFLPEGEPYHATCPQYDRRHLKSPSSPSDPDHRPIATLTS